MFEIRQVAQSNHIDSNRQVLSFSKQRIVNIRVEAESEQVTVTYPHTCLG